ncbi:hypothetical protein FRB98_006827 [Tulasnella sp. 332]|nr:hypothetical protein FRB98_006827 [Tulasnella sp. 332]
MASLLATPKIFLNLDAALEVMNLFRKTLVGRYEAVHQKFKPERNGQAESSRSVGLSAELDGFMNEALILPSPGSILHWTLNIASLIPSLA